MKIAVPTRENQIDDHFGHCEYYTIFTISPEKQITGIETLPSPEGCGCKSNIASVLEEKGVTLMLAGNMGQGALQTLQAHGIEVVRGCSGSPAGITEAWLQGNVHDSGTSCDHHECHEAKPLTFKVAKP